MITFTDPNLYLKGTCQVQLADPASGVIKYSNNKFQTGNLTAEVNTDPIRAGLGNPIAAIIPSDSGLKVAFSSAAFSMLLKGAHVGSTPQFGAVVPKAKIVNATATTLTVPVDDGAPVAQYGFSDVMCYVLEVGAVAPVAINGTPYEITDAGVVTGFTAEIGKAYQVWYFVTQASAQSIAVSGNFDPSVFHFTAQMAVYANVSSGGTSGTRVGWLDVIVPLLKFDGTGGGVVGDQTTADTSGVMGQAIAYEEAIVSGEITDCAASNLAFYVYRPDNASSDINGLAVIGGVVTTAVSTTKQIPVKYAMANGEFIDPPSYSQLAYTATAAPTGTTVDTNGVINAGATAGDFDVTINYPATGTVEFTTKVQVSVT